MRNRPPFPYRFAASIAPGLARRFVPTGRAVLDARQASLGALAEWGLNHRDTSRACVIVHGASAGELRQAEPVLHRLRARHPDWQFVATHFSPSGETVARQVGADAAGYFPWDTVREVTAFLDALKPTAIAWCKHDLWPTAVELARGRGIRLGLFAGTVRRGSGRRGRLAKWLLGSAYEALSAAGAASREDADALIALGVPAGSVEITGDPRYDAVIERLNGHDLPLVGTDTLVAGSTWPADEDVLLDAFRDVLEQHPSVRLIIVPHRPTRDGWTRLAKRAAALGLPSPVPLEEAPGDARLIIGRRVGSLAFDYARGSIAHVGGGFRRGGVHSVLEPAACGRPILAGPIARDSRDARILNQVGALEFLPRRRAAAVLGAWWINWVRDPAWRERAGSAARAALEAGRGAADRSVEIVERLVGPT
jgi:3-deoxy-D-manno-octulosonic-acid transferase